MRARLSGWMMLVLFSAVAVHGSDVNWLGVNTLGNGSWSNDHVEDAAMWSGGAAPGPADAAVFNFNDTRDVATRFWKPVVIRPDSTFAPGSMRIFSSAWNGPLMVPNYLLKTLDLESFSIGYGYSSAGQGEMVFRIGASGVDAQAGPVSFITPTEALVWSGAITLTGYKGSPITYALASYATVSAFVSAVNADTAATGIYATNTGAGGTKKNVSFYTDMGGFAYHLTVQSSGMIGTAGIVPTLYGQDVRGMTVYGMDEAVASLNLQGESPIGFSNTKGCWGNFKLATDSRIIFANTNIVFAAHPGASGMLPYGVRGTTGSTVDFPTAGGSITLADPGTRGDGSLWINAPVALRVRSDQQWHNPSGIGFLRQTIGDGQALVHALDAQPLNNMGEVPFYVQLGDRSQNYTIPAGTYQAVRVVGSSTSGGSASTFTLTGPVFLAGRVVHPGNNSTVTAQLDPDYSLILSSEYRMETILRLAGHSFRTAAGIRVTSPYTGTTYEQRYRLIDAAGSELTVDGDIQIDSAAMYAGFIVNGVLQENRRVGIGGDAGTVLNLHGSFATTMRSLSGNGFSLSTVNLLGGSSASPETWEVTADPSGTSFGSGTGAIGLMQVGSETAEAHYRLVNASLNDNDPSNLSKTRDGEVLLSSRLRLANGVLDLGGHGVKLAAGPSALQIETDATLDLNTGTSLRLGERVTSFVGLGDQTAAWQTFTSRVRDSSQPGAAFKAVLHTDGNTYWAMAGGHATLVIVR